MSVMPLSGGEAGRRGFVVTGSLARWAERDGTGVGFGALSGFRGPKGAVHAPAACLRRPRWEALTSEEREEFPALSPDFLSRQDLLVCGHAPLPSPARNPSRQLAVRQTS
jgi:Uma2 family endonuclease